MKSKPLLLLMSLLLLWGCADRESPSSRSRGDGQEADASDDFLPDADEPDIDDDEADADDDGQDAGVPDADLPDADEPDADAPEEPIPFQTGAQIDTTHGRVEGREEGELRVFKGIPYAAAPTGERRFKAPAPAEPWGDEALAADNFGPSCLQSVSLNLSGTSEDCLTLNVWAHLDDEPRPVMVWIYGGGFVVGETAMATYDGADLAQTADAVVVSLNYRLGVLGNLALPELRDEDPRGAVGNMGLLDQIEALRWIKANAAAFGGDPQNITVFGESAGAISTCALMGSPLADDLFDKAIIQSGNCALFTQAEGQGIVPGAPGAIEAGEALAEELGCGPGEGRLECLRALEGQELVRAVGVLDLLDLFALETPLGWTIDGVVLEETPYERLTSGRAPQRPVLAGSNGNEAFIFTSTQAIFTRADFARTIAPLIGGPEIAEQVVALYSLLRYPLAKDAFNAFVGDFMFNCNTYHAVRALEGRGYYYELAIGPTQLMTPYGPLHGADIFYVFSNFLASGVVPSLYDLELSAKVQQAWGTFARTGIPTWEGGWPPARAEETEHMRLDLFPGAEEDFRDGRCDELQRLGVLP